MILSDILFNNLTNKLRLKAFLIKKKKFCIKNLIYQTIRLKKLKENGFNCLGNRKTNQDFSIMYVINIIFLKTNITVQVSNAKGNLKLFYSAGMIDFSGKQKKKQRVAVSKLISLIFKKATFLDRKPIALHLHNVNACKNLIVYKFKLNTYIKTMKINNKIPYNGCKRKKLRRKKNIKRFK